MSATMELQANQGELMAANLFKAKAGELSENDRLKALHYDHLLVGAKPSVIIKHEKKTVKGKPKLIDIEIPVYHIECACGWTIDSEQGRMVARAAYHEHRKEVGVDMRWIRTMPPLEIAEAKPAFIGVKVRELKCKNCGTDFTEPSRRGRANSLCPECRENKAATKLNLFKAKGKLVKKAASSNPFKAKLGKPSSNGDGNGVTSVRICETCGNEFEIPKRRGRPPKKCEDCR